MKYFWLEHPGTSPARVQNLLMLKGVNWGILACNKTFRTPAMACTFPTLLYSIGSTLEPIEYNQLNVFSIQFFALYWYCSLSSWQLFI